MIPVAYRNLRTASVRWSPSENGPLIRDIDIIDHEVDLDFYTDSDGSDRCDLHLVIRARNGKV